MGNKFLDTNNWKRTSNEYWVDFKEFSLNGITGADSGNLLSCFGKPHYHQSGQLCYFDLGLDIVAFGSHIAYMYVYLKPRKGSILKPRYEIDLLKFQAFPGTFRYGDRMIELHELENCDALVVSFKDIRFQLYEKIKNTTAYIANIDGQRRTVVFSYLEGMINFIIIY